MSKHRRESKVRFMGGEGAPPAQIKFQSAVVERELVETLRRIVEESEEALPPTAPHEQAERGEEAAGPPQPPWSVVQRYLTHGEDRAWVEGHAETSVAFADVIEALRQDQRARRERERRRERPRRSPSAAAGGERPRATVAKESGSDARESTEPPPKFGVVLRLLR
jgi:hypothetical protein